MAMGECSDYGRSRRSSFKLDPRDGSHLELTDSHSEDPTDRTISKPIVLCIIIIVVVVVVMQIFMFITCTIYIINKSIAYVVQPT